MKLKHGKWIITGYARQFSQTYVHYMRNRYPLLRKYSGSTDMSSFSGK